MAAEVLTDRALNRATLARQLLLERAATDPIDAIEHLVGLQAQNPFDPYLALWSRLDRLDPRVVGAALEDRTLVRIVVMRGTVHLVTATDALELRPLVQPVLDAELARHFEFAPHLTDVDLQSVLDFAVPLLSESPMSGRALRGALADRFPDGHAPALAYACRCLLPLVQVPPRGVWGETRQVTVTPLQSWVGRPLSPSPSIELITMRYLRAFGPATTADVAAWSRLTGLREVLERLRPQLRTYRDERGRELFDVRDGLHPDPDTPAPIRFLPEYDNLLLSHADRTRFGVGGARPLIAAAAAGSAKGSVLIDGRVGGVWHYVVDQRAARATVVVEHGITSGPAREAMEAEAQQVARFWHPKLEHHDVRLVELP